MAVSDRPEPHMNPGDAIHWTNPDNGQIQVGIFIARYGTRLVIETAAPTGHLGLRYVDPKDVRSVTSSGNAP